MPFARVDMLVIGFSMAGSPARHGTDSRISLHFAVLFFVLAVYTKKTSVAAPLAAVLMLLIASRADGFRMIAAGSQWPRCARLGHASDGRPVLKPSHHLQHQPLQPEYLIRAIVCTPHVPSRIPFAGGRRVGAWVAPSASHAGRRGNHPAYAELLRSELPARIFLMLVIHSILSRATLLLVGKSGAGPHDFIEWLCTSAALLGFLFGRVASVVSGHADPLAGSPR